MKFISEIFQDIDGSFSSKRTAFFVFVLLFVVLTITVYFRAAPDHVLTFLQGALDKVTEIIKWLGGFIVAEQGTKFAAKGGDK